MNKWMKEGASAFPGNSGFEFSLNGSFLNHLPANGVATGDFWDGTTDGQFNYSFNRITGAMLRFKTNWSDPTTMFTLSISGSSESYTGVTWDATNNSLWLSTYSDDNHWIRNFTMSGALLSEFEVDAGASSAFDPLTWLALDPADGTLWVGRQTKIGEIHQYSKAGEHLSTVHYTALDDTNTLGGEFQLVIPTPATAALLVVVACTAPSRRRRNP